MMSADQDPLAYVALGWHKRCIRAGLVTALLLLLLRGARVWRGAGRVRLHERRAAAARLRRSQCAACPWISRRNERAAGSPGLRGVRVDAARRLAEVGFFQLIAAPAGRERKNTEYG
jgi:hypothetical protein